MPLLAVELQTTSGIAQGFDLAAVHYGLLLHERCVIKGTSRTQEKFTFVPFPDTQLFGVTSDDARNESERGEETALDLCLVRPSAMQLDCTPKPVAPFGRHTLQRAFVVLAGRGGQPISRRLGLHLHVTENGVTRQIPCVGTGPAPVLVWSNEEWRSAPLPQALADGVDLITHGLSIWAQQAEAVVAENERRHDTAVAAPAEQSPESPPSLIPSSGPVPSTPVSNPASTPAPVPSTESGPAKTQPVEPPVPVIGGESPLPAGHRRTPERDRAPAKKSGARRLFITLGLVLAIAYVWYDSAPLLVPARTLTPLDVPKLAPSTPRGQEVAAPKPGAVDTPQTSARALTSSSDENGLNARIDIINAALSEAVAGNEREIARIIAAGLTGEPGVAHDLLFSLARNRDFTRRFDGWQRLRKEARAINDVTLDIYRIDVARAFARQRRALALDPWDQEIAGNLGLYAALNGDAELASQLAIYNLALRRSNSTGRSADWHLLGAALALQGKQNDSQGAYLVGLAVSTNPSGLCKSLLAQQAQFGEKLKAPIDAVFRRIADRGGSNIDGCAYPPDWRAAQSRDTVPEQKHLAEATPISETQRRRGSGRFIANNDGTVTDSETGVVWADSDNGRSIDWKDAGKYCAGKGTGWQLPTVAQLQGLYDSSGKLTRECGAYRCSVTPLIRLSLLWAWSNESKGSSEAWYVALGTGGRLSGAVADANFGGALCVRAS